MVTTCPPLSAGFRSSPSDLICFLVHRPYFEMKAKYYLQLEVRDRHDAAYVATERH